MSWWTTAEMTSMAPGDNDLTRRCCPLLATVITVTNQWDSLD